MRKALLFLLCYFFSMQLHALVDPTQPPAVIFSDQLVQSGPLALNAILISPTRRVAVINAGVYNVGEEVVGYKIIAINQNSVYLEGVSGKITLFLVSNKVKRPVK